MHRLFQYLCYNELYFTFIVNSCLIATRCVSKTMGTIKVGNQLKGKFKIAIFGWSNANFCMGDGAESKALITIFSKSPRQITFQINIPRLPIQCFEKPKNATIGAVIPENISRFLPSKVIRPGMALCRNNQNNTNSTGILTMLGYIIFLSGKLSINCLPLMVVNSRIIVKIAGKIPVKTIFGGSALV